MKYTQKILFYFNTLNSDYQKCILILKINDVNGISLISK